MSEAQQVFELRSGLYDFNRFFEFPPEIRPQILDELEKTANTIIILNPQNSWESRTSYVEASYNFARRIDPGFRLWNEKGPDNSPNLKTYEFLVKYYEMIMGKTKSEILEAIERLKD